MSSLFTPLRRALIGAALAGCCSISLHAATASYPVPVDADANGIIDAAEIQTAVNAASGVVFLPAAHTYSLTTAVTLTSRSGVSLVGEGASTVLHLVGNTEGVVIDGGTGCGVRQLKIVADVAHATNALRITGGNEHFITDVTIVEAYRGIQLEDGIGPLLANITLTDLTGDYGIKIDGSGGSAKADALSLHHITGTTAATSVEWVLAGRSDGVEIETASFSGGKRGIRAFGATGPKYLYTNHVTIENVTDEGIVIGSGNDVLVNDTLIDDTGATGFVIGADFVGGAVLTDLTITDAAGHGLHLQGGRDIGILEPLISATGSALTPGTGAGIKIAADCSYVSVTDGMVAGETYGLLFDGTTTQSDNQDVKMKNVDLSSNTVAFSPGNLEGAPDSSIVIDNTDTTRVTLTGSWSTSATTPGYYGANYLHDGNTGSGKSVRYTPNLAAGDYEVFVRWTANINRADNVPVDVVHAGGTSNFSINQELNNGVWVSLGTFTFNSGTGGSVLISNTGANGYVIADAVRFVAQ